MDQIHNKISYITIINKLYRVDIYPEEISLKEEYSLMAIPNAPGGIRAVPGRTRRRSTQPDSD